MSNKFHKFWQKQPQTEEGMILFWEMKELPNLERAEILAQIPPCSDKRILELGAGIGRYTKFFMEDAAQVVAVDFIWKSICRNRELTCGNDNVLYLCADAANLEFPPVTFDIVFSNWLLMYLPNEIIHPLIQKIYKWLKPSGYFFLRESCHFSSTNRSMTTENPTYYRDPTIYLKFLKQYFKILQTGNVKIYEKIYKNPFQIYWLCKKEKK